MPYFTLLDETLEVFGASYQDRVVYDDNLIDRVNHYYTGMMLFMFVVVIGTPELVGTPIECWCPTEFNKDYEENANFNDVDVWVKYVNYICWISNTYYIPMSKPVPMSYEIRQTNKIYYYQWTPLIFLVMAFLFKMPRAIWKYLSTKCGVGIKKFMTTAKDTQTEMFFAARRTHQINLANAGQPPMDQMDFFPPGYDMEIERQKVLQSLGKYISIWCSDANKGAHLKEGRTRLNKLFDFGIGRHHGNFLMVLLIFVRFLYLVNVAGQLILLNEFLADDFYIYGYDVMEKFLAGKDWALNHNRFPRVTLCDFDLRQLTNVQRYTLQCVLPINLYNEKVFIALWFWLTFILVVTFLNFAFTLIMALTSRSRENYIIKYLLLNDIDVHDEKTGNLDKKVKLFIYGHLKFDGIFLLQMLSNNAGSAITQDIVRYTWEEFNIKINEQFRIQRTGSETSSYRSSAASLHSIGNSRSSSVNGSGLTHRTGNRYQMNLQSNTFADSQQNGTQKHNIRDSFVSGGRSHAEVSTEKKVMKPNETFV
ncbi:innexin unc-9-like isoform X1 [Mytilus trossulus]|uniref:innexin unc-9-like isoform X1 n=1 Tax=Mytilus trossulus TaxID=6551 RepID=UPI003007E4E1